MSYECLTPTNSVPAFLHADPIAVSRSKPFLIRGPGPFPRNSFPPSTLDSVSAEKPTKLFTRSLSPRFFNCRPQKPDDHLREPNTPIYFLNRFFSSFPKVDFLYFFPPPHYRIRSFPRFLLVQTSPSGQNQALLPGTGSVSPPPFLCIHGLSFFSTHKFYFYSQLSRTILYSPASFITLLILARN